MKFVAKAKIFYSKEKEHKFLIYIKICIGLKS